LEFRRVLFRSKPVTSVWPWSGITSRPPMSWSGMCSRRPARRPCPSGPSPPHAVAAPWSGGRRPRRHPAQHHAGNPPRGGRSRRRPPRTFDGSGSDATSRGVIPSTPPPASDPAARLHDSHSTCDHGTHDARSNGARPRRLRLRLHIVASFCIIMAWLRSGSGGPAAAVGATATRPGGELPDGAFFTHVRRPRAARITAPGPRARGNAAREKREEMTDPNHEIRRRRTFAIISHPDAGKTTLTEKLLLYGGAIHLAGSVKARRAARHATSDWMALERERGISVTSSVLQFDFAGCRLNLLDTPGHQDFSEDTYRTLVAADSAVMLLDNRKGVEEQTRKLFAVCRRRRMPIFTFVNKCDRAGADPLQLLDDVEADLGIRVHPLTWPVHVGDDFIGVIERATDELVLFERGQDHGQSRTRERRVPRTGPEAVALMGEAVAARIADEIALLDATGGELDRGAFLRGEVSPGFFGSALTNFGVEPFLRAFMELAPPPVPRVAGDAVIDPQRPEFSGFVFKIQANMDPKHRDRIAFVRIVSGRYEPGMTVRNVRANRELRLAAPQQLLAR